MEERKHLQFDRALLFAAACHMDQVDKMGKPYILHPITVAGDPTLTTETEMVVALLHDVMEDCGVSYSKIRDLFGDEVAIAVDLLTRRPSVHADDYYLKIKTHPLAHKVKLADIKHNMSPARLDHLDKETRLRLGRKYEHALTMLYIEPAGGYSQPKTETEEKK